MKKNIAYITVQVTIQPWPQSQLCMDCEHGEFLDSETFNSSHYICFENSMENDGIYCPLYTKRIVNKSNTIS
jgi:hypothetical protein